MQNAKIGNARRPNILRIKISGKSSIPIWSIVIEIRPIIFKWFLFKYFILILNIPLKYDVVKIY